MEYKKIKYIDKPISKIILGTTKLTDENIEESYKWLDEMYSLGINTFDTAAVYKKNSEATLIKWIADRGIHDNVVLITKGAHRNEWRKRVTSFDIMHDITNTLAKPGADYIDIYLLHRDDPDVRVESIVDVLNRFHEKGKIHSFGGSNWSAKRIEQANEYAYKFGLMPFSSTSPNYSLANKHNTPSSSDMVSLTDEKYSKDIDYYAKTDMPIFSYSALSHGFFSGLVKSDNPQSAIKNLDRAGINNYICDENFEKLKRVEILAKMKNSSVSKIAMAWVLNQPLNIFAVTQSRSIDRMASTISALDIKLNENELKWLNLELNNIF